MGSKALEDLTGLLTRQLARLERYGRLVEKQAALLERQDYEALSAVLARKDRILAGLEDIRKLGRMAAAATGNDGMEGLRIRELFTHLMRRLDFFAGREQICLDRSIAIKEDIASELYALRKGKKMLKQYRRTSHNAKARFKDIRT